MNSIAINARLGDGILISRGKNACLEMQGTKLDWLTVKRDICLLNGFNPDHIVIKKSGYTGKKNIYTFITRVDKQITEVYNAQLSDILRNLKKEELIFWYLDDGSYHKHRFTMHLYCNALSNEEVGILVLRITELYGIEPKVYYDRKKDGRVFPYLYFPRILVEDFRLEVEQILRNYKVKSLFYKIGQPKPLRLFKSKK